MRNGGAWRDLRSGDGAQLRGFFERERCAHVHLNHAGRRRRIRAAGERLDGMEHVSRELRHRGLNGRVFAVDQDELHAFLAKPQEFLFENAFSSRDDGDEKRALLIGERFADAFGNHGGRLRFDGHLAVRAVFGAELHVDEAQKVIELRHRRDGGAHAAPGRALLDRHRRGNAPDAVDIRFRRRLDHGARVGVEAF